MEQMSLNTSDNSLNITERNACISNLTAPRLSKGDVVHSGVFFRNLKSRDVASVYTKDEAFGKRLKRAEKFQWTNGHHLELSVNLAECVKTPCCSIRVHPNAEQYDHVWELDLDAFNAMHQEPSDRYVALYDPEPPNTCHFVITSTDGTLSQNQILGFLDTLAKAFPPTDKEANDKGKSPPEGQRAEAQSAMENYRRIVKLHELPCCR